MADQQIVAVVARKVHGNGGRAHHRRILHIRTQRVCARRGERHFHPVFAFAQRLDDHVAGCVHAIHVIAQTTDQAIAAQTAIQRVIASTTVQRVGGGIAGQQIVHGIALNADACGGHDGRVFHMLAQRIAAGGEPNIDQIRALAFALQDHITRHIHFVDIVALAARQQINARTANQRVVTSPAFQHIIARAAGELIGL